MSYKFRQTILPMNDILTFEPFYKSVIWGGDRIATFKGLPSKGSDIGESWELSPMPGHESVVADGPFKGRTLPSMLAEYGCDIMGARLMERYDGKFPLLIKFIDSSDDLSIQVHPDDDLAMKRHNSLGKTEMWYSIMPAEGAYLYAGFKNRLDPEEFRKEVAENTIVGSLQKYYTHPGDVFFLPAGRVHSIGRGNFVLEIQEASDITYRIYDYDRRDAQGNPRQLHIEESVDAINFDDTEATEAKNVKAVDSAATMVENCPYFTTELFGIGGHLHLDLSKRDSFSILIAVKGNLTLTGAAGKKAALPQGTTVLVPASLQAVDINGEGEVISVYIP